MSSNDFSFSERLLNWYDACGRDLPWRTRGPHPNPYIVWIAEIMLQQTTVKTVIPYFERFRTRFPDIRSLADAEIDEVLLFWQGLGYYARARKLHECAKYLVSERNGVFPETRAELLKLPGIGPYTAASISALAFDRPETIIDGNVIRLMCRYYALEGNADDIRNDIFQKADALTPSLRAADYTSAILDAGATVCTPQTPRCGECPVSSDCLAFRRGLQEKLPVLKKPEKVQKRGPLFLIRDPSGAFLIRKRTEKGLLSGLMEFPWEASETGVSNVSGPVPPSLMTFPVEGHWVFTGLSVRHVFTHIRLVLDIYLLDGVSCPENVSGGSGTAQGPESSGACPVRRAFPDGLFVSPRDFGKYAFSTLMKKVIRGIEQRDFYQTDVSGGAAGQSSACPPTDP